MVNNIMVGMVKDTGGSCTRWKTGVTEAIGMKIRLGKEMAKHRDLWRKVNTGVIRNCMGLDGH